MKDTIFRPYLQQGKVQSIIRGEILDPWGKRYESPYLLESLINKDVLPELTTSTRLVKKN